MTRAIRWAIGLLLYEGAMIHGLARQLGTTWNTVWSQVQPLLARVANDSARFENVQVLGVDEQIWHHRDPRRRGPKETPGCSSCPANHNPPRGTAAGDDVRCRIRQETLGHRGRKGEPLYGIRNIIRADVNASPHASRTAWPKRSRPVPITVAVEVAYQCAQDLREVFHPPTLEQGRRLAERLIEYLPSCPTS